ncbi:hypothetical protein GGI42DRAFT_344599 [Trichoderma sp. SZMC 28013]
METVLVGGASGNIGVSVIIAALRSGRRVLAIVRNNAAEQKIIQHVGTKDRITFVEAQVTYENSVQKVVDRVKAGELPDFQHVVGKMETTHPTQNLKIYPNATWTLVTGSLGALGFAGVTAISQGALFSLASVACLENLKTNVRFNEVYLGYRDSVFAHVYEAILANQSIRGCRITVSSPEDVHQLKYKRKLPDYDYDSLFAEYM